MIRENYILLGSRGILKGLYIKDVVATSSDADVIHVFADFDTSTESTNYRAIARVRRPDGELFGPTLLPLTVAEFDTPEDAIALGIDEGVIVGPDAETGKFQVACRDLTLSQQMLELTGEVGVTIVYQEVDSLGAFVRDIATSYVVATVRDAIPTLATEEEYSDLLEIFLPRDLGDLTNGVQPTVVDHLLIRQGGATKLITVGQLNDLLETGITVFKKVAYDTIAPAETINIGETRWNADAETLETRVGNDEYLLHGQKLAFKCKNTSGVDIAKGTPVYITGASGSSANFYIAKADNRNYTMASRCVGLTTEDIDDGAWGKVCFIGVVNGINTNAFEVGDVVYLGDSGIITTVRPTTNVLALGVVIQKSTTQGRIALRPIFFPRPEDLSTVHYSALANGDILVKDATGWVNYALANKATVADLTDGTITVKKAENDKDGNAIGITYVKVSGVNAMTGNLNLGTNKIINVVDGTADQDGATIKNIDTKITAHDGSEVAHLYIRELIEAQQREMERLDGRGKSYGEIAYTTAQLLALSQEILDDTITDAVALGHGGEQYIPSNGDLVYDTGVGAGVAYHEWEFNGTNWVDNGLIGYSKASNEIYGMIKGDETYLSVVSGLVQVLKSDYADKIGTSGGSYTYEQLLSALSDRYTKAEVDALLDALKTAFGWEETDLGDYTAPIDLSGYDLVVLKYESDQGANDISITEIFSPSAYAQTDVISLVIHSAEDDSVLGAGSLLKGATTWAYSNSVGDTTLSMRGYKIKPLTAENMSYDNSLSGLMAENTQEAIDEVVEDIEALDTELDVVVEETRDVGTTEISFENGKVVAITSDNCTTNLLYGANGNIQKITETYADGKSYETTYTKDVEGRIKTMTKAEV